MGPSLSITTTVVLERLPANITAGYLASLEVVNHTTINHST